MATPLDRSAVFDFENILPQLEFLPIAARRALDHAGLRLSLEGWRSLGLDDRCQLVAAGAEDLVDVDAVLAVARRTTPPAQRIEVVGDPDALAPPEGMTRMLDPSALDARQWARLRALDRYALAHVHRRAVARNDATLLGAAYENIITGRLRSFRPAPGDASGTVRPSAFPQSPALTPVPPPPAVPRADAWGAPASDNPRARAAPGPFGASTPNLPNPGTPGAVAEGWGSAATRGARNMDTSPRPPPVRGNVEQRVPSPEAVTRVAQVPQLSNHLNEGGEARMVDVASKAVTLRRAVAVAAVCMRRETIERLLARDTPKGDVLAAARIAGIQGSKRTSEIIPLCHPVALTRIDIELAPDPPASRVLVTATAEALDRTGVEMEAMVGVSVACLTIYDMLKGIDREITITEVKLMEKSGGRTGHYVRKEA